ncbi:amino acid ABC transporter substrate-binding protein [Desulfurivibrio dismutans]|uniref:amino acid ABC transporter substrate-binding protein n=1 Tax=Desulfurivibrio dismutans TaxID=1398908 RepID=UPI0023DC17D1|nr:amino acid ABC transporter substrate-binding protein [Desulfurivibrio alkaliphilus]MDF1614986.1 amino acid ABC transporter substrate-binding protein [Desulfurivibrio alkaliphilus]
MIFTGFYRRRRLPVLLLALIFILVGEPADAGPEKDPLQAGASLGLSGKYATMAHDQKRALRLWEAEINATGGLLGREVRLTIHDDHSDPQRAQDIYQRMFAEDGVELFFAPFSSEITGKVLPLFEQHRFPLLASGAVADELWQQEAQYIFGIFTTADKIPANFMEMLFVHGVDGLALLHSADPFSRAAAEGVRKRAGWLGLELQLDAKFSDPENDFTALLTEARDLGSEVVIMAGHLEESIALRRAMLAMEWTPRVYYSPQGPANPSFIERLGPGAEGVFGTEQWQHLGGIETPETEAFLAAYRQKFAREASYFSVAAYSAAQIMTKAIRRAGTLEGEKLRIVLTELDATCLTGRFRVDAWGRQIRNFSLVTQWQDGRQEVVWPRNLMTAEPRL